MNNIINTDCKEIYCSTNTVDKILSILSKEKNKKLNFRIYVIGGGCSGLQYGMILDDQISDDDIVIRKYCSDNKSFINLLIDSISYQYLHKSEIKYTKNIYGEKFSILNPNAKITCKCGSSFNINIE